MSYLLAHYRRSRNFAIRTLAMQTRCTGKPWRAREGARWSRLFRAHAATADSYFQRLVERDQSPDPAQYVEYFGEDCPGTVWVVRDIGLSRCGSMLRGWCGHLPVTRYDGDPEGRQWQFLTPGMEHMTFPAREAIENFGNPAMSGC